MEIPLPPSSDLSLLGQRYSDPMYCLRCNTALYEVGEEICPTCGLQYDTADAQTFRSQPMFLRWKYWFPGLCLSIVSGVISYAICLTSGELGFALFVAVPISFGAILGYATRVHVWLLTALGLMVISSVVMALVSMHLAGLFCGLMLAGIFLVPAMVGIISGFILRCVLQSSRWDQRWFLPLIGFVLFPYAVQVVESELPRRRELAVVRTTLTVDATPEEAWNAVMFYEQVEHQPPWLLRLSLPRPLYSQGDKSQVGEIVRCFYDRGVLAKRISRVEPRRLLAFEVVEQRLHFERDIKLRDGSFRLDPIDKSRTRIVLTTRYERQLAPQFVWEPIERHVVHTLHGHVLEGMRRKVESKEQTRPSRPYQPVPDGPTMEPPFLALSENRPHDDK